MSLLARILNAPPPEAIKEAEEAQREFFKRNLFLTAKHLLGYKDLSFKTHGHICMALQSNSKRKLIVMPRGSFKSSIASVSYPIWLLLKNPNERILLDSELYSNSKNFLREIRGHFESEKMTRLFGESKSFTWNEGEIIINQRTQNYKEASITCTGIGAEKTGQHYSVVILDDMNSPSNSGTPEGCKKVLDHYRYMQAILEPGGTMIVVGTRYSATDLIQFIIDNEIYLKDEFTKS